MPLGQFQNQTSSKCTLPLLDESLFLSQGGYQPGRYCGVGSFEGGTTCCFPCPIQDWVYPREWESQLRVPNYLSILSVILCCFLLLSFAVLPPEQTRRHYLSVGLLFPVLFISMSFAIPVTTNPGLCHDQITPNDMHSSQSCAWTGSFVVLGGLGCVIWVFLRSLWLHIRIFWDKDPGHRFKWGSIVFGTILPFIFLAAILVVTGFSYRMGQTCLPNHEHAIATFWIWLVVFSILAFLLQFITTFYCFYVFMRTVWRERRASAGNSFQQRRTHQKVETWANVRNLFLLQWRNILVNVFVIIGSISFFIVFWTQDGKLGQISNDPKNIKAVKLWIICQTLSKGDKNECRKYVKDFTVNQTAVLTSLILASLVGIEIFVLLFRPSMITGWLSLFRRTFHRIRPQGRPGTPELTSFDNPEKYLTRPVSKKPPFFAALVQGTKPVTSVSSANAPAGVKETIWSNPFDTESESSVPNSKTPTSFTTTNLHEIRTPPHTPTTRRLSQIQPSPSPIPSIPRPYTPMRDAPAPLSRPSSISSASINIGFLRSNSTRTTAGSFLSRSRSLDTSTMMDRYRESRNSGSRLQRTGTGTGNSKLGTGQGVKRLISAPITESFVHVNGAFLERGGSRASARGGGPLGSHPVDEDAVWDGNRGNEELREHGVWL